MNRTGYWPRHKEGRHGCRKNGARSSAARTATYTGDTVVPDSNIKRLSVRLADELARHDIDVGPADVLAALAATDMTLVQTDRSPAADAYRDSLEALHEDLYRELPNNGNG